MKISFNWLKTYFPTDLSPEEAAAVLTDTGLEVEKTERRDPSGGGLDHVVTGHVLSILPHPDADRLKVTTVDAGESEPLTIVCGAPNVEPGQKVPVAKIGAVLLPESEKPLKIKKSKIRGQVSEGMICAEDELGIGTNHDGIMVLPADTPVGIPMAEFLKTDIDYIFEIGLTPNRTDAFGHYGVARDLAARLSHERKEELRAELPEVPSFEYSGSEAGRIHITIKDEDGCGRYTGTEIAEVKVGPSPEWLAERLRAVGLNPINNVVDVTNFVMLETGQPLHAFDADKIKGGEILVKTLPEGTAFTTLEGTERKLSAEDLMICDTEGGLCIAGVLGGIDSGVSNDTQNIFLESAWFNPVRVRKTAKRHALNTDASFRFERGADPEGTLYALKRAAALIIEICGGRQSAPVTDVLKKVPKRALIDFSLEKCNALCGTHMQQGEVERILTSLDFRISGENGNYQLTAPAYRADVTRPADVYEEVLRIYGFNAVPVPERMSFSVSLPEKPDRGEVIATLASALAGRGLSEMMANGLTRSDRMISVAGADTEAELVAMLNPLSRELDVLRPHLINSVLEATTYNLNRQAERVQLFEIGTVYKRAEKGYAEDLRICIGLCGPRFSENWNNPEGAFDISDLRGHVAAVFNVLGLGEGLSFASGQHPFLESCIEIKTGNRIAGHAGTSGKKTMKAYGLKKPVLLAEISLGTLLAKVKHAAVKQKPLPKFPAVRRDFSLLLNADISFSQVEEIAYAKGGKLLREVGLFDVYEGKSLPEGKKSYAVSFILQDNEKTLNDKIVDKTMGAVQKALEEKLGAQLR